MMISPNNYIEEHKKDSFDQLIKEKQNLIDELNKCEKMVFDNNKISEELLMHPSPEVRYQMTLEYLSALCLFIEEKFNKEIVWRNDQAEDDEYDDNISD